MLTPENLYWWIRWTPAQFQQYCHATRAATPAGSVLSHEARVLGYRYRLVQGCSIQTLQGLFNLSYAVTNAMFCDLLAFDYVKVIQSTTHCLV
jgi:hypothetical protein